MASRYIEAAKGESWRSAVRPFRAWIQVHVPSLDSFGYSEGDSVSHGGSEFICIDIPDHHGEKVALFEAWAKTTGRIYGIKEGGVVRFSDGTTMEAPS